MHEDLPLSTAEPHEMSPPKCSLPHQLEFAPSKRVVVSVKTLICYAVVDKRKMKGKKGKFEGEPQMK